MPPDAEDEWSEETIGPFKFTIKVAEDDFNAEKKTLFATMIWSGARAVSNFLVSKEMQQKIQNQTIIELGSGVGLPSLTVSRLSASRVVATDYPAPAVIANLLANVEKNNFSTGSEDHVFTKSTATATSKVMMTNATIIEGATIADFSAPIHVQPYKWGDDVTPVLAINGNQPFDVAIASECLWKDDTHIILIESLDRLLKIGGIAIIGFSHHHPGRSL